MRGLSSCQNLAFIYLFILRSSMSGTYWRVATMSKRYLDLKKKKKKKKIRYALGMDLGSVLLVPMSDTCWTRVLGQNRCVRAT